MTTQQENYKMKYTELSPKRCSFSPVISILIHCNIYAHAVSLNYTFLLRLDLQVQLQQKIKQESEQFRAWKASREKEVMQVY